MSDQFELNSSKTATLSATEEQKPSVPGWFSELVVFAHIWVQSGRLSKLNQRVRVVRGRMGRYEVLDFVLCLVGYGVSSRRSLKLFFQTIKPFSKSLAALWEREKSPSASALSRFLQDVTGPPVEALRELFNEDLQSQGIGVEAIGGLYDREGARQLIFDIDGTKEASRQRGLPKSLDYPPTQRRRRDSAPGYNGRKRGEVVRTRTTVQQAHTHEWLGTFGSAGNGKLWEGLERACQVTVAYLQSHQLPPEAGLLRMDGAYGWARGAWICQQSSLGYLMRCSDYGLLSHPQVQQTLQEGVSTRFEQPDSPKVRHLYDVGFLDWSIGKDPSKQVSARLVVAVSEVVPDGRVPKVGKRLGKKVYELFVTERCAQKFSAKDLVSLYFGRGGFERTLSEEDKEEDPDRWCSNHGPGQEFWQILSQWIWNERLRLGFAAKQPQVRRTVWADAVEFHGLDLESLTRVGSDTVFFGKGRILGTEEPKQVQQDKTVSLNRSSSTTISLWSDEAQHPGSRGQQARQDRNDGSCGEGGEEKIVLLSPVTDEGFENSPPEGTDELRVSEPWQGQKPCDETKEQSRGAEAVPLIFGSEEVERALGEEVEHSSCHKTSSAGIPDSAEAGARICEAISSSSIAPFPPELPDRNEGTYELKVSEPWQGQKPCDETKEQSRGAEAVPLILGSEEVERALGEEVEHSSCHKTSSAGIPDSAEAGARICEAISSSSIAPLPPELPDRNEERSSSTTEAMVQASETSCAPSPQELASGQLQVARATGRGAGKFGGDDFKLKDDGTVRCPAGKTLKPVSRRKDARRERIIYRARACDCNSCKLASDCRGGKSLASRGRRVSVNRPLPARSMAKLPPPVEPLPSPVASQTPTYRSDLLLPDSPRARFPIYWDDLPASQLMRFVQKLLLQQQLEIQSPFAPAKPVSIALSRAQRAHRRLTWSERLERNAALPLSSPWEFRIYGLPTGVSKYLMNITCCAS